jgi:MSHA biogenesis protein MshK
MVKPLILSLLFVFSYSAVAGSIGADPTRPPQAVPESGSARDSGWTLYSVMITPTLKTALINDRTVKQGERINGARIVRIQEDRVILRADGQTRTLRLFPAVDKKDRAMGKTKGETRP